MRLIGCEILASCFTQMRQGTLPLEITLDALSYIEYRDGQKVGPLFLSNSQAGLGYNFSQPRAHHLAHIRAHIQSLDPTLPLQRESKIVQIRDILA